MKLSVMQENLARGLSVVSRAVSNRSLPVLTNVLLKTEDGGLKLTATNLEIGITYWVPGKIEVDGATSVPARLLTDLVNSLPGSEPISLELGEGETLHIRAGRFESNIKGIPAEDFPTVQTAGERPITRVAQKVLRQALDETAFAAASDEARPILTGVLAKFEGDQLTLAAADNYRIAVKTITVLDPVEETSVVIPARALHELARVLSDTDEPVSIVLAHSRNQLLFHIDGIDLVTRLIDGQYPNYQSVLPASHATRAVLDREELLRAVRPAALIAHESANIVKLGVGLDGDAAITVSANAEVGDHVGRVEAADRGRRDDDRVQRPLPGRRPDERRRGPVRARAERAALAGRLQADRRRPLRPRRHAAPDDLLTAPAGAGGGPGRLTRLRSCVDLDPGLRSLRRARGRLRARAAADRRAQRRRQDDPARGDRPARLGPLAPDLDRRRARSLGQRARPDRGARRRARRSRSPSSGRPARSGARKRIRVNGVARRAAGLVGLLRTVVFAPEEMLLVVGLAGPPAGGARPARDASARRPTRRDLATYGRTLQQRNSLLRAIREEQAGRDELRFWDASFLDAGGGDRRRAAARSSTTSPGRSPRAHAEIAPDEAGAARLAIAYATNAPALPGESPRDALARRLAETADKEVWNGSTLVGPHRDDLVFEPRRPGPVGLRVARPAADRDPRLQARRARPPDRAGRPAAAPPPRRRVLRARSGPPLAPRPADRRPAPGVRDDDDARRPRPGARPAATAWEVVPDAATEPRSGRSRRPGAARHAADAGRPCRSGAGDEP